MTVRNDILPPRYRDPQHLAHGGMGDVYRATDTVLRRTVAVKVLADRYADDEGIRKRFTREAQAAARLSGSSNTVTIFDVGEWNERPYIVMELAEGGTLEDRLKASGAQDPSDVIRWLAEAAGALDAAHAAGIVHRDVKPGNLLLDSRGEVRVADFGVASAVGMDSMTMTGTVLGTAGYLSPEQAMGQRATPASDRYALGIVAYELLTGQRPFAADSPTAEASAHVHAPIPSLSDKADVPRELDPVLRRALAKDPAERFESSTAFVAALREALSAAAGTTRRFAVHEEHVAPAPPVPPPDSRPSRLLWVGVVLAALLALGGGLAAAALLTGNDEPRTETVRETQVTTKEGRPTTVVKTVTTPAPATTTPATTAQTTTPTTATTAPSSASGEQLTDQATALLGEGKWAEAEAVSRQALAKLDGSGTLYEAYANYNLGRALVEQGRCDEALPHLDKSEQIQGSRREIREARAQCS